MNDAFLYNCTLCPRACGANRTRVAGLCGGGDGMRVAKIMAHFGEEPCISGTRGSGAVFFAGCSLHCGFCQNRPISFGEVQGENYSVDRLCDAMLDLQSRGVHNINLVTAAHYAPFVARALVQVKPNLHIPVVYNSSGYETVEALRLFEGLVDVYLPDCKYDSPDLAARYSGAANYPEAARAAITEMVRQAGSVQFDGEGILRRGVLIRHLVLPACRADSMRVLRFIAACVPQAQISLMRQYTPQFNRTGDKNLDRKVTTFEYKSVLRLALDLGLKGYRQGADAATEAFTPDFLEPLG